MNIRALHPESTWTCKRPSADTEPGGMSRPTLTTIGTPTVGVEDITSLLRRELSGRVIDLGLRLWDWVNLTAVYRQGDLWTGTYKGQSVTLECVRCEGPWPDLTYVNHLEIYLAAPVQS